jgi:hypothetical protein
MSEYFLLHLIKNMYLNIYIIIELRITVKLKEGVA